MNIIFIFFIYINLEIFAIKYVLSLYVFQMKQHLIGKPSQTNIISMLKVAAP